MHKLYANTIHTVLRDRLFEDSSILWGSWNQSPMGTEGQPFEFKYAVVEWLVVPKEYRS